MACPPSLAESLAQGCAGDTCFQRAFQLGAGWGDGFPGLGNWGLLESQRLGLDLRMVF